MTQLISVLDINDSIVEAELDGEIYFLRMSWNSEGEFWVLGVEDYDHTVIVASIRVVPDTPLLALFRHRNVPPGELYAISLDDTRGNVSRTDFADGTCQLIYVEAGEVINAPV